MVPPSFVPNFGIKPRTCQSARRSGLRPRRPRPIRAAGRSYAPDCPRTHGWPCKSTDHPYNVQMMKFDWAPAKAASNLRKHGVSFEDAKSVFYAEFAVQFYDDPHSSDEERFLMLGMISGDQLLHVCPCDGHVGGVVCIISTPKP